MSKRVCFLLLVKSSLYYFKILSHLHRTSAFIAALYHLGDATPPSHRTFYGEQLRVSSISIAAIGDPNV